MTQKEALDILKTGANVFLTGEPGSGKTFVTNAYVRYLKQAGIEVAVTASTGIAATHLGGMTIHSWSGIGIKKFLSGWDLDRITTTERIAKRVERTKVLVIDEISMLDGATLECVDRVCQAIRRKPEPFGGMQVVFVGDFFQLPPIAREDEPPPVFAFAGAAWQAAQPMVCYLSEQYRQEDETFLAILAALRRNMISSDHRAHLEKRRHANAQSLAEDIPKLFSHNADVDRINSVALERIPGVAQGYEMESSGRKALVEQLKRGCLSPEKLFLKKGAVVMFTKNSPTGAFVNGTLGTVLDFDDTINYPIVKTRKGKTVETEPMDWTITERDRTLAKISQIPLRLAWAMTVHKSQGMSLDAAFIDLQSAFVPGQGYVALSRVRTLSGLYLSGWNETALTVHPDALASDEAFREQSAELQKAFANLPLGELTQTHHDFVTACGGTIQVGDRGDAQPKNKVYTVEDLRKIHPNAYKSWSAAEDALLTAHHNSGMVAKEIAERLGRQKGAIRSRLVKIGLVEPRPAAHLQE